VPRAWLACGARTAPPRVTARRRAGGRCCAPLRTPAFRRLLAVYLVNGIASAVPATLVLFFIRDRLQARSWEPLFLASLLRRRRAVDAAVGAARGGARPGARAGWAAWRWPS
jgi:hypothetical protein